MYAMEVDSLIPDSLPRLTNVRNGWKAVIADARSFCLLHPMTRGGRRIRRREGDILKVNLGDGRHAYAQVSYDPLIVFFEGTFTEDMSLSDAAQLPVLFRVWVHNDAIKKGFWPVLGNQPLTAENAAEPFFYKQDAISGAVSLYHSAFADMGYERPASVSECEGLECAAVWDPDHILDRLRDHYAGLPNRWLENMKIDRRAYS